LRVHFAPDRCGLFRRKRAIERRLDVRPLEAVFALLPGQDGRVDARFKAWQRLLYSFR
jgi:hypothetical protein